MPSKRDSKPKVSNGEVKVSPQCGQRAVPVLLLHTAHPTLTHSRGRVCMGEHAHLSCSYVVLCSLLLCSLPPTRTHLAPHMHCRRRDCHVAASACTVQATPGFSLQHCVCVCVCVCKSSLHHPPSPFSPSYTYTTGVDETAAKPNHAGVGQVFPGRGQGGPHGHGGVCGRHHRADAPGRVRFTVHDASTRKGTSLHPLSPVNRLHSHQVRMCVCVSLPPQKLFAFLVKRSKVSRRGPPRCDPMGCVITPLCTYVCVCSYPLVFATVLRPR